MAINLIISSSLMFVNKKAPPKWMGLDIVGNSSVTYNKEIVKAYSAKLTLTHLAI